MEQLLLKKSNIHFLNATLRKRIPFLSVSHHKNLVLVCLSIHRGNKQFKVIVYHLIISLYYIKILVSKIYFSANSLIICG